MKNYFARNILALLLVLMLQPAAAFSQVPFGGVSGLSRSQPIGDLWARTDLFFGTNKPDGTFVTDMEFKKFMDEVITPRFPDGLTLLAAYGQFRGSSGTIQQERSFMLILLYPQDTMDSSDKIEEIRSAYKRAFRQESVLRVDSAGFVSF